MKIDVTFPLNCCLKTYYVTDRWIRGVDGHIKDLTAASEVWDGKGSLAFSGFPRVRQQYSIESVVFVCHIEVESINYEAASVWPRGFHFPYKEGKALLFRRQICELSFIVCAYKLWTFRWVEAEFSHANRGRLVFVEGRFFKHGEHR